MAAGTAAGMAAGSQPLRGPESQEGEATENAAGVRAGPAPAAVAAGDGASVSGEGEPGARPSERPRAMEAGDSGSSYDVALGELELSSVLDAARSAEVILRQSDNMTSPKKHLLRRQENGPKSLSPRHNLALAKKFTNIDHNSPEMKQHRRRLMLLRSDQEERRLRKLDADRERSEELTRLLEAQSDERVGIVENRLERRHEAVRQRLLRQQDEKVRRDHQRQDLAHEAKHYSYLSREPLYKKMEKKFKKNFELPEINRREELLKQRRKKFQPLDLRQIDMHDRRHNMRGAEVRIRRRANEKANAVGFHQNARQQAMYYKSKAQQRIEAEDRLAKEQRARVEQEKVNRQRRRANYSKFVREMFVPSVDEHKRHEISKRNRKPDKKEPRECDYNLSEIFADCQQRRRRRDRGREAEEGSDEDEAPVYRTVGWDSEDEDQHIDDLKNQLREYM